MAKIVILGAGVMGTALCVPATHNNNTITLVGTPLDQDIILSLKRKRYHPNLQEVIPGNFEALQCSELQAEHLRDADIVVLGVSSAGVEWSVQLLAQLGVPLKTLSLVTKGLEPAQQLGPLTYAHTLPVKLRQAGIPCAAFVGIAGPCIAREIVVRQPTTVVFASENQLARDYFAACMQTPDYRVFKSVDIIGVEACAALKNLLAIGVSAMISRYTLAPSAQAKPVSAKNPTAAAFNQAVQEMARLSAWIGGTRDTAFDHAGMGDLHVTVGGGRNSRLGMCLGQGMTVEQAMQGPMAEQTVEGLDTGRILAPALSAAIADGTFVQSDFALTLSILRAIEHNVPFEFDFTLLSN